MHKKPVRCVVLPAETPHDTAAFAALLARIAIRVHLTARSATVGVDMTESADATGTTETFGET